MSTPERPPSAGGSPATTAASAVDANSGKKSWSRSHGRSSGKAHKFNANHLLNFQYEDLAHRVKQHSPHTHHQSSGRVDAQTAKKAYILQNFQFVLCEAVAFDPSIAARCLASLINFDELPPWDYVRFVICRDAVEEHICPVCLDAPQAPRITSCGHIFCYPCLMRHLDCMKDKGRPRACPVCHTIVVKPTLRPLLWHPITEHRPGKKVTWTLLGRAKECCQLLTSEHSVEPLNLPTTPAEAAAYLQKRIPVYGAPSSGFSRFIVETPELAEMVQQTDAADLNDRISQIPCPPPPEAKPVTPPETKASSTSSPPPDEEAEHRASNAAERKFCEDCLSWVLGTHPMQLRQQSFNASGSRNNTVGGSSPNPNDECLPSGIIQQNLRLQPTAAGKAMADPRPIHVYRSGDGQQVYLHFLNMKMLRDAFPTADEKDMDIALPSVFEAVIEDIETVTQTSATRTSFKAIAHIPLHASFHMCFVDLSHVVPSHIMRKYQQQIDDRRRRIKAVQDRDEETAVRCLKAAWEKYKGAKDETYPRTPDISPEMLAQMPSLEEVLPSLDLGPSATTNQGNEEGDDEDNDGDSHGSPPDVDGDTPVYPGSSWIGTTTAASMKHSYHTGTPQRLVGGSSTLNRPAKPATEDKLEKQRKKDQSDAIASLFGGGGGSQQQEWEDPSAFDETLESGAPGGGKKTGGGGGGGGKKGKSKPKTISLTSGGRREG